MNLTLWITLISELTVFIGVVTPIIADNRKVKNGMKCQLRSEMLRIYYRHLDTKTIRQYEYENFVMLYEAYKALKGNSFIDKIFDEVREWKVIT